MTKSKMKYSNADIRRLSDAILSKCLTKVFADSGLIHRPFPLETQDDAGEDKLVQLEHRDGNEDSIFSFYIQNKGLTDLKKHLIKSESSPYSGCISYSLKLRNAERYYKQLNVPILITLCDVNKEKVYWYAIQLDDGFRDRIRQQKESGKSTIQIYVDRNNIISDETLNQIIADLLKAKAVVDGRTSPSGLSLYYRKAIEISHEYQVSLGILGSLIKLIKDHDGLLVVPQKVLVKLYPFSLMEDSKASYGDFTLSTDNEELIEYFSQLSLQNGRFYSSDADYQRHLDNHIGQEQIRQVVSFLMHNLIYHIEPIHYRKKRVCIHKLYTSGVCECEKCSLDRYEFKSALSRCYKFIMSDCDAQSLIKKAFVLAQIGDFKAAAKLLLIAREKAVADNKFISNFIASFNVVLLKNAVQYSDFTSETLDLVAQIEAVDIQRGFDQLRSISSDFRIEILRSIHDKRFISDTEKEINECFEEARKRWMRDQRGGATRSSNYPEIINKISQLLQFTNGNLILYSQYRNFEIIVEKAVETILIYQHLKHPDSIKVEGSEELALDLMMKRCATDSLKKILDLLTIKNFNYSSHAAKSWFSDFESYINNLPALIERFQDDQVKRNDFLIERTFRTISNSLLIAARLDLPNSSHDYIAEAMLKLSKSNKEFRNSRLEGALSYFLTIGTKLRVDILERWAVHALSKRDDYTYNSLSYSFPVIILKKNPSYQVENKSSFSNAITDLYSSFEQTFNHSILELAVQYAPLLNSALNRAFGDKIEQYLESNFEPDIYYTAAIHDLIPSEKLFLSFSGSVKHYQIYVEQRVDFFGIHSEHRKFDQLINLTLKLGQDLRQFQHLHSDDPYYRWILDIHSFDYNHFDPYWLMRHCTVYYVRYWKTEPKIKEKLAQYILTNRTDALTHIFINHFSGIAVLNRDL